MTINFVNSMRTLALAAATAAVTATAAVAQNSANRMQQLLNPEDVVFLMVDHQTGLLQIVEDHNRTQLRANVRAMATAAEAAGIPVVATSSVPTGPNGPLIPEIEESAPDAVVIPRDGEINAWDNDEFRAAVEETGRRTIVISGILTSVCVAFPALEMAAEGYDVIAVIDASGDYSELASQATIARLAQSGVKVESTFSVLSQIHGAWTPENAATWAGIYSDVAPSYRAVLESFYAPES